ncbi:tetratricopeptide repeat-containing sulfotransferase family protein [Parvibaculum sp.]|uniref:tetratricopeptide repeat-containing sulfotransferase family protein n=1 Tax=Parvibaculum sp. TaxID=2024848 RepID=UPI001DBC0DBD|nr:tetratricopeptide repeat-containing sulfotransferase family protein [Parvibaculum sp.]MBX3489710.1 sulfotransferase [Parvibaculum sp.]
MAKKPSPPGPAKSPSFMPPGGGRATVGLPRSAFGGPGPTVGLPAGGQGGLRPGAAQSTPLAPGEVVQLLQLGGAHLAAGRLDHAGKAAAHILKTEPQNPDALHLLGLVALGKGDAANAEKLIATAAALMPRHVNVWVNLGNAQREQGKADEALIAYRRAEAINPDYPDIFLNRGILYKDSADYAAAIVEFERLIELMPADANSYLRAASAATDAGRFRDARTYLLSATERATNIPLPLATTLSATYERLGDLEDALTWANKALAIDAASGGALAVWSKAKRRLHKGDKAVLAECRNRLAALDLGKVPVNDARLVSSELAQICHDEGDIDASFGYFTQQNEHTARLPELGRVNRTAFIDEVSTLIDIFTEDFVSGWRALPAPGIEPGHAAAPVFLVGFPRSGTTLLDQIFDAHPQAQVFEEQPFLRAVRKSIVGYPQSLAIMDEGRRTAVRRLYWQELCDAGADLEGKTVINKMPLDIIYAGLIHRVFPEARIVFALRHPADCVLSCFMQDFVPNGAMLNFLTLEGSARFYERVMTLWQTYRTLLPLNVHEVRYENLVADLRGEVGPALEFLGLGWHDAVSDPAAHALARGTIKTPSYSQVTQPIYSSSADRWRRYEKHLQPVMPILEPHIKRFGYSL